MKASCQKLNIQSTTLWAILDASGHTVMQINSKIEPTEKFIESLFIKPK